MAKSGKIVTIRLAFKPGKGGDGGGGGRGRKKPKKPKKHIDREAQRRAERNRWATFYLLNNTARMVAGSVEALAKNYYRMNEDYSGENTFQNAKRYVSAGANIATHAVTGFLSGGVAGAVIASGVALSNALIGRQGDIADAYRKLREDNYDDYYLGVRAGLIDGGRGTDN